MPSIPSTADPDTVPDIDEPESDTDRGLPDFVTVPTLAFIATVGVVLVAGVLTEKRGESLALQRGDESDDSVHKSPFDGTAGYSTLRNPFFQLGLST